MIVRLLNTVISSRDEQCRYVSMYVCGSQTMASVNLISRILLLLREYLAVVLARRSSCHVGMRAL